MSEDAFEQRVLDGIEEFADPARQEAALRALAALGAAARNRVRNALRDGRAAVRRGCALWLWQHPDPADLPALLPLLRDPSAKVRHTAVVVCALAHGRARSGEIVPLLVERAREDASIRVRRQAVTMLAYELAHPDLEGFFDELLASERDAKLLRFARAGVRRCREGAAC